LHHIVTNASCTTKCLAPVAMIPHETVGIKHGLMTTIHAYTADQNLLDAPHKDFRRARAAALNLVRRRLAPPRRSASSIPELAGKLNGYAVRVPTPTGSIVDLTIEAAADQIGESRDAVVPEAIGNGRHQALRRGRDHLRHPEDDGPRTRGGRAAADRVLHGQGVDGRHQRHRAAAADGARRDTGGRSADLGALHGRFRAELLSLARRSRRIVV
jgi:hypothetical protein